MPEVFADDFTGTEGDDINGRSTTTGGGTWTRVGGNSTALTINASNQLKRPAPQAAVAYLDVSDADHYAEAAVFSRNSFPVLVRVGSASPVNTWVGYIGTPFRRELRANTAGTISTVLIVVGAASVSGAVIRIEANGDDYELFQDGVSLGTWNDAASFFTSNTLVGTRASGSGGNDPYIDDFACGTLGAAPVPTGNPWNYYAQQAG
jgi:hypothetical protein